MSINPLQVLKRLPSKYYIIDVKTKTIIETNDMGKGIVGKKCFSVLHNRSQPCKECPFFIENSFWSSDTSKEFIIDVEEEGKLIHKKVNVTKLDEDHIIAQYSVIANKTERNASNYSDAVRLERTELLADIGYWESDLNMLKFDATVGAKRILGYDIKYLSLRKACKIISEQDRRLIFESFRELVVKGKEFDQTFRITRENDNSPRWIRSIATVNIEGKKIIGVIHDITDFVLTSRELHKNENLLSEISEAAQIGGWDYHIYHEKFSLTPELYRIFELPQTIKITLHDFVKLFVTEGRTKVTEAITNAIKNKEDFKFEEEIITYTGKLKVIRCICNFKDSSEGHRHLIGIVHDITEEYNKQLAIDKYKENIDLLNSSVAKMISLESTTEISAFILSTLKNICTNTTIMLLHVNDDESKVVVEDVIGIPNALLSKTLSLLGYKIKGKEYPLLNSHVNRFKSGHLEHFGSSLNEFSGGLVPKKVANAIGRLIRIKDIHSIGVKQGGKLRLIYHFVAYGNVELQHKQFVESFIQQAGILLERRLALKRAQESNEMLSTLIENLPDAIYMKDTQYRKVISNRRDILNCGKKTLSEVKGKTDWDLFPKEMASNFFADDKNVIDTGIPVINREELVVVNNQRRWTLTSKIPFRNQKNEIIGLIGIGRDITELKTKENQINLLQQTVEQSNVSILITDTDGVVQFVNSYFSYVSGYSEEEVLGENPRLLKSGVQDDEFYKELWETITQGNTWVGEFNNKRKDGSFYWENAIISPITNSLNEITHFVAIKEEISDKKKMIEDLKDAKLKAEENDKLKSAFLMNMSHEIRTPLNAIMGFSNLICSGKIQESKAGYYKNIIQNSGERLLSVVNDILDISLIQSNQLKIYKEPFSLNPFLIEIFDSYNLLKAKEIPDVTFSVACCYDDYLPTLNSDRNRLYQVFKNLLDNAFKFTKSGYIRFGYLKEKYGDITFFVEDTGIGIPEEKQELIFQTFHQADNTISKSYGGTGLGLSIIKGLVGQLDGKVWLETNANGGSTFYFTLHNSTDFKADKYENGVLSGDFLKGKNIVAIEDDPASITFLDKLFSMYSTNLKCFSSPKEGLEYVVNNKVDVVLLDIKMPDMDGYEVAAEIRSVKPLIPIIVQSAFGLSSDKDSIRRKCCDAFVSKPIDIEKLIRYLQNCLAQG